MCNRISVSSFFPTTLLQSSSVHPPSDQLQLYYMSSQKFQSVFSQQESLSSYIPYDSASEGGGNTSAAFIKPANWKEFVQIMWV